MADLGPDKLIWEIPVQITQGGVLLIKRASILIVPIAALLLVGLSACGGESNPTPSPTATSEPSPTASPIATFTPTLSPSPDETILGTTQGVRDTEEDQEACVVGVIGE